MCFRSDAAGESIGNYRFTINAIFATLTCKFAAKQKMVTLPDWDDLRYFLELARAGKLAMAAERLGVEPTTISRRLDRLEERLQISLFDRRRSGYVLTETGRRLLARVEAMESEVIGALVETGSDMGAVGRVRLGTPEAFGVCVVAPRLHRLSAAQSGLQIELIAQPQFPCLVTREVDISVTMDPPTSGRYVVSRLTDLHYYLFAAPAYLAGRRKIETAQDLAGHEFVDYVHDSSISQSLHYLEELIGHSFCRFTSTSIQAQCAAAASGYGLILSPPYCTENQPELVQAWPGEVQVTRSLMLAVPEDLLRLRRVRVVWDFLRGIAEQEPHLFRYGTARRPRA